MKAMSETSGLGESRSSEARYVMLLSDFNELARKPLRAE
jgi:hypothetical protein